jgi:hypothetical protein
MGGRYNTEEKVDWNFEWIEKTETTGKHSHCRLPNPLPAL